MSQRFLRLPLPPTRGEVLAAHPDEMVQGSFEMQMCLMRRKEAISSQCLASLSHDENLVTMCYSDIDEHCSGITPGNSKIHTCLKEHKAKLEAGLSESCSRQVDRAALRREEDLALCGILYVSIRRSTPLLLAHENARAQNVLRILELAPALAELPAATSLELVQAPGELLFVPSGWYHQVENVRDTISINHNWFNACDLVRVWRFLCDELHAVEKELAHLRAPSDGTPPLEGAEWHSQCACIMRANCGMSAPEFTRLLHVKATELAAEPGPRAGAGEGAGVPRGTTAPPRAARTSQTDGSRRAVHPRPRRQARAPR